MAVLKRDELKGFFGAGQIPLSTHFANLIDSSINKAEDGIKKEANSALKIKLPEPNNNQREGILFFDEFETSILLTQNSGVFSAQLPIGEASNFLTITYTGNILDQPKVEIVQGTPNGNELPRFELPTPHQLRIIIINNPTPIKTIQNAWDDIAQDKRGDFQLESADDTTLDISLPFKWRISVNDSNSDSRESTILGGLNIGDTTTDHLFIQEETGNVGIGTTTDLNNKLSVKGGIKADSILIGGTDTAGTDTAGTDAILDINSSIKMKAGDIGEYEFHSDATDSDSNSILLGTYNGKTKGAKIRFSGFESGGESESFEIGQDKDENNESNFFIKSGDLAPSLAILKNGQVTIGIPDVNVEVKGILKLGLIENLEATINDLLLNRSIPMIAENFEEGIVFKKTARGMLVHTDDFQPFDSIDADRLVSELRDDRWVFPTPEQLLDIYKNLHEGKEDSSGFGNVVYLCKEADTGSFKGVNFATGEKVEADIDFASTKIRPVRPF